MTEPISPVPQPADLSAAAGTAKADSRDRRVLVWWGVGLGLLAALGLFCWLFVGPHLETKAVVAELKRKLTYPLSTQHDFKDTQAALRRLGGPERALPRLRLYTRLPGWLAPDRPVAVELLGKCGAPAVLCLLRITGHAEADLRLAAVQALGEIHLEDCECVGALSAALKDPDERVRRAAGWSIGALGHGSKAGKAAVPALTEALRDPVGEVRYGAAFALARIGPDTPAAIPNLLFALKDRTRIMADGFDPEDSHATRRCAAYALGKLGSAAEPAIPALRAALADPSPDVIEAAAWALGEIGPAAKPAVSELEGLLNYNLPNQGFSYVREAAAAALKKIRGEEAPAR